MCASGGGSRRIIVRDTKNRNCRPTSLLINCADVHPAIDGPAVSARRKSREAAPAPETRSPALFNRFLPDAPPGAMPLDRRTTTVFIVSIVLLVVFQYFGKPESYRTGM